MNLKEIIDQLNVFAQCKKYRVSLWQCPQFLFLITGVLIIVTSLTVYYLGIHYGQDPQMISLVTLVLTAILLVVAFSITQGFERLAEANRMKSEFISVVSHQLRSPLSNLRWALDLLMSGRLGRIEKKQTDYFRILRENIARMKELVSDLLTVSRIETATLPQKKEKFSLGKLAEELISELGPFAKASNVKIEFEFKKTLPKVFADPFQTRQVMENLLDNAIRYIKGKGEVFVKVKRRGKNIYFEVRDTGVGIPKEEQKYIFQKFFRAENVLRYETQGSGLGLFISKSIIEKSGGEIGFKSKEGEGSTFWFTLPIG